ncbi:hypothetical protein [Ignatzschineria indica]|nr:hypothetical protein [Ignatzschineria indica]
MIFLNLIPAQEEKFYEALPCFSYRRDLMPIDTKSTVPTTDASIS